ncbi:hypothetical protein H6800_00330 [Candidatus Nomurabacteria bacterium]|nr:hypothetical protein [Candidatus Nomurabacteria bacterium]
MNEVKAKEILDKIVKQVFQAENPLSLSQFFEKFAFDVRLPNKVVDATDGSTTWANSVNPQKFVKMENATNNEATASKGLYAKQEIKDLNDLLSKWDHINLTTAEHVQESINVAESDLVDGSEDIFHSSDIHRCKNIIYCDGCGECEFMAASTRTIQSTFCIRVDDSIKCSDSFGVARSAGISNCLFIHDCGDMQDSMFCTNMRGGRYCIANMQFEKEEYEKLRKEVVEWILTPA